MSDQGDVTVYENNNIESVMRELVSPIQEIHAPQHAHPQKPVASPTSPISNTATIKDNHTPLFSSDTEKQTTTPLITYVQPQ